MVVCKHWLRGLCKKGDHCKFLHQYDLTRMPECYFYSKFGDCSNKECPFLHVKPAFKSQDCPWYDQGFCKDGPLCKYRHVPRIMCLNYLVGFCPEGPKCQFAHLA
ncbi:putative cleavage and polyadenylation specificity factor subunit 4-like protein isoform X6 [Nomascus leucogenys]|uniref:putative cleavage and polyadenylation specificity factor subunit 4-like protein isoform X6 n=2 Tax=Hylobatidae TaxID=9577 RepID=UPI00122D7D97|nr:putative cleavage and polyadenylation specificity factor subunit 4-like protein isoform X6 [Nomascus leucogenys]